MIKVNLRHTKSKLFPASTHLQLEHSKKYKEKTIISYRDLLKGLIYPEREEEWMRELDALTAGFTSKKIVRSAVDYIFLLNEGATFEYIKGLIKELNVSKYESDKIMRIVLQFSKSGPEFFEYYYKNDVSGYSREMAHFKKYEMYPQYIDSKFQSTPELVERFKLENTKFRENELEREFFKQERERKRKQVNQNDEKSL